MSKSIFYSNRETEVLVECVRQRKDIIMGSFSSTITHDLKEKTWREITEKINAVSSGLRTVKLVRKKWSDLASRTKAKAAKLKKTQTGDNKPVKDLTPLEEQVIEILGEIAVSGLKAGVDTLDEGEAGEQSNSMSFNDSNSVLSLDGDHSVAEAIPTEAIPTDTMDPGPSNLSIMSAAQISKKRKISECPENTSMTILNIEEQKLKVMEENCKINKKTITG